MARITLSKELKAAISGLSHKEKDKLLFRLVAGKPDLARQLEFKLLEDGSTTELRREELAEKIKKILKDYQTYYYSPGYLLLELRSISALITKHVKTTKDKYGEIALNLLMLNQALTLFGEKLNEAPDAKTRTIRRYVIKRTLKILKLLDKLHQDYQLDFQDDLSTLFRQLRGMESMKKEATFHQPLDLTLF